MKRVLLTVIILIIAIINAVSQDQTLVLKKCVDITGNSIISDNLGNIYLFEKSSLKKFDADGNFAYSYTELSDGFIYSIDVSDALKIIIFNKDFGKIKFLDNKLSVKSDPILLSNLDFANATLVATSYESGFWLYDPMSNQLVRFNNNSQMTHQSGNISDLTGREFDPSFIVESDNMVYLNDPRYGVFVFDRYATYMKVIPVKNIKSFQVFDNNIFYLENNIIKSLDTKTYDEKILKLPVLDEEIISATIDRQNVSVLTKSKFCIFKFN